MVHHMGQGPCRYILQNSQRAPWVPGSGHRREELAQHGGGDTDRSDEWPHGCCITKTSHAKENTATDTQSVEACGSYSTIFVWAGRDDTPSKPGSSAKEATTTTPGFPPNLILPASEGAYLLGAPVLFDLLTIKALEVTIFHTLAMGEVHYHLQAQSLARVTLLSTSDQEYWEPFMRDEEAWVIIMLHPIQRISKNKLEWIPAP